MGFYYIISVMVNVNNTKNIHALDIRVGTWKTALNRPTASRG